MSGWSGLDPQGPVAETIEDLWLWLLGLGAAVFVLFAVLLVWGLFRSGGDSGAGRHALVRRWIGGGGVVLPVVALVVVFAATVVAMRATPSTGSPDALEVEVIGHQWWYEVRYPDDGVTSKNELHLPAGREVVLRLTSADVIHSFWVPELAGKLDMLPDDENTLVLRADEPGEYQARCAEFCGLHHADMVMPVIVEPEEEFTEWLRAQA